MITSESKMTGSDCNGNHAERWIFLAPSAEDGDDIFRLISACPPLDVNSSYCNFLQSTHFSRTCVIARYGQEVAGFISAYCKPDEPSTLFVWQVAVGKPFRGRGLAMTMLDQLLGRASLSSVKAIETTITQNNDASWGLFKKLDERHGCRGEVTMFLDHQTHFKGNHDTEYLYRIPLNIRQ
ncbi:diaminobutyrate acetyltransferase [Vibrio ostreicida]|nr:diaminobutyrate acetyltransferase [Vibrio ostreicida]